MHRRVHRHMESQFFLYPLFLHPNFKSVETEALKLWEPKVAQARKESAGAPELLP